MASLFERGGAGLAGRGVAQRIPFDADVGERAAATLAAIDASTTSVAPGTGPVAFGALPFAARRAATLVVPEIMVGRADDGTRWVTTIGHRPIAPDVSLPSRHDVPREPARLRRSKSAQPTARRMVRRRRHATDGSGPAGRSTRSCSPARSSSPPTGRSTARRRSPGSAPGYPGASLLASTASWAPAPSCSSRARRRGAGPADGRHRPAPRRPDSRRPARRGAPRLAELPPRAPGHHRHGPRHAAAVLLLPRLRGRAVGRRRWPTSSTSPPSVEGRLSHPPASVLELVAALHPTPAVVRPAPRARRWRSSPRSRSSTGAATPARSAGSTPAATARARSSIRSAQIDGHDRPLYGGNGIVADSDPAPSWPRPGPSSRPCSAPSSGPERV